MAIHTNTCKKSEKKKGEPKKSFSDEKNLQQGILSNKEVNAHIHPKRGIQEMQGTLATPYRSCTL